MFIATPPKLIAAPAEPNVAAASDTSRSAGARSWGGPATINIWSLRDPAVFEQHTFTQYQQVAEAIENVEHADSRV